MHASRVNPTCVDPARNVRSAISACRRTSCRPWVPARARGRTPCVKSVPRRALGRDTRGLSGRRTEARARRGPSALPHNSYSPCQTAQSSSFPRRVAAPGFCLSLFHPPRTRGERSAERRSISVVARFGARRSALTEARRASGGTRSPLRRSTVAIFGRGPRFHLRHFFRICAASSSQPGRSAWRAGSRTSRGRRLRAAAAGRHSPLRLRHVSGDGPSDERGCADANTGASSSQLLM
jgi:hypothetical protein